MSNLKIKKILRLEFYSSLMVIFISVHSIFSGKTKLLRNLKNASYPWFGDVYSRNCPLPSENWPTCYNLRPDQQESIIVRAGLPEDTFLTKELEVVFSAPEEDIDVCGKEEHMRDVKEFTLNEDGIASESALDLGAEIYRNQPNVNWDAKVSVSYTLIFWDVGFFKIRGWFYNIQLKRSRLFGETNSPYYPPANPTPNVNPILIMLFEETRTQSARTNETMHLCVETIPNQVRAERCRNNFKNWISEGLNLLGLQVYYTNGASFYEKFRACTESFICDSSCTEKFNGFFQDSTIPREKALFFIREQKKLDFYVNFRFTGVKDKKLNIDPCCNNFVRRKFEFRPMPGTDKIKYVGYVDPKLFHSRMTLEMSGPTYALKETATYYSVLIVDINAPCLPYQHYAIVNLEYPGTDLDMKDLKVGRYVAPWPHDGPHYYLILLYSHTDEKPLRDFECDSHRIFQEGSAMLRSVSWFRSSSFWDCIYFDCPTIRGEENPFTFIGVFKHSSEFPAEVLTSPNINSEDKEKMSPELPAKPTFSVKITVPSSTRPKLPAKSTFSVKITVKSSTVKSLSTKTNKKNTSPTKVTKKVVTTEKSKSGSCSHFLSLMSLSNILLISIRGILK